MTIRNILVPTTLAPLMLASCGDAEAPEDPVADEQPVSEWGYEGAGGPENWGTLSSDYAACDMGTSQSPVDLVGAERSDLPDPQFDYGSAPRELVNLGHTLQVNYESGSSMMVGDTSYELAQFHFHTPSEHRLDGQEFPAEAHFVHRGPNGELAVVGVFIEEGSEADELTELWNQLPQTEGESVELSAVRFDEQALLPDDAEHYLYPGSLTTPPCTEGVTWMVMNEPIEMSAEQISSLESVIGTSNRPAQPLGNRELQLDSPS